MGTEIVKQDEQMSIVEQVVVSGDLAKLTSEQRVIYYRQVCESTGLNPFTKPFDYITLNGKLTLYANKGASDQLRASRGISIVALDESERDGVFIIKARAMTADGRTDESTGAVSIVGLKGDALANAIMKAETKAKRRVTLSIAGLGFLDESEIETIPAERVQRVVVAETGEIVQSATKPNGNGHVTTVTDAPEAEQPCGGKGADWIAMMDMGKAYFTANGWKAARPWLIEKWTTARTPENVRTSSKELTPTECKRVAAYMRDNNESMMQRWAKYLQDSQAKAMAAPMAGEENPFGVPEPEAAQ